MTPPIPVCFRLPREDNPWAPLCGATALPPFTTTRRELVTCPWCSGAMPHTPPSGDDLRMMQRQIESVLRDYASRIRNAGDCATIVRKVLGEVAESAAEWTRQLGPQP